MAFDPYPNQHGVPHQSPLNGFSPITKKQEPVVPAVVQKLCSDVADRLNAAKARYIIILADGTRLESGGLELVERKKRTRTRTMVHPMGTLTRIYGEKIKGMNVGDVVTFAPDEFLPHGVSAEHLKKTISSGMYKLYGPVSWESIVIGGHVEVMRIR